MKVLYVMGWMLFGTSLWAVDHAPFDGLLKRHVRDGLVDYKTFSKEEHILDDYLQSIAEAELDEMKRPELMALWINAYNAFTVKLILETYPLDSIRDLSEHLSWQHQYWMVGGEEVSLNLIEHHYLREMGDDRIHFALNCASMSCPRMYPEAFRGDRLEEQLVAVTMAFMTNGAIVWRGDMPVLSKIFDWYAKDFGSSQVEVLTRLSSFLQGEEARRLREWSGETIYQDYDWSLNEAL